MGITRRERWMMSGLSERMLSKYRDDDYVIKLKAHFLLRICIGGVIVTPLTIVYTIYLNLNNPVYNYGIHGEGLAPLIVLLTVFAFCILILTRGFFSVAAHLLFITAQVVIWSIMVLDMSTPVGRLDTIVVLFTLLSMAPLIVTRNILLIPLYSALAILIVFIFTIIQAPGMGLSRTDMWDFIADSSAAAVIVAIISYNLFSINRTALAHSEESRTKLAHVNEELNATNEELEASNEEIAASMEELTATNEEFEAQNRELIASQEIISESLEEKTVLIKEVHHRVKNNMQIVSSLLNLQAMSIEDPRIRQIIKDAVSRIHSMALIHEKIYRADNFSRINMAAYITDLAKEIIELYSQKPDMIHISSNLESIHLSVDQAIPCGILINEILTNSIKHGCKEASSCKLELGLTSSEGTVTMTIADSGPGIDREALDSGSRKTLGLQIIEALAQQLNAKLDCNVDRGTRFTIRFTENAV
jgi:two-component sensor histidine kinase